MTGIPLAGLLCLAGLIFAYMAFCGRRPGHANQIDRRAGLLRMLPGLAPSLPYDRKPLLTAWERRALLAIRAQLPTGFYVCAQVRLADMLRVTGKDEFSRSIAVSKVASKSVDFAVVELLSGDVVLVIELDDRTHDQPNRRRRDDFVNAVLERAEIPVRRFRPDTPIHVRDFCAGVGSPSMGAQ